MLPVSKTGGGSSTRGKWNVCGRFAIDAERETVLASAGQRNVEREDRRRLDIGDTGRWFAELNRAFSANQFVVLVVEEAYPERVHADFVALRAQPDHQMGARVHRREPAHPHMPEDAEH